MDVEVWHGVAEDEGIDVVVARGHECGRRTPHRLPDRRCLFGTQLCESGQVLQRLDEEMPEVGLRHGREVSDVHEVVAMDLDARISCCVLVADETLSGVRHSPTLIASSCAECRRSQGPVVTDWRSICPASWQARTVEAAVEVLPATPGLLAAWLGGSLATGLADRFSDVDLNVVVPDEQLNWWRESWASVLERCAGPLVLAQAIGDPVVGGFALTTAWEHVDLVVHARSTLGRPDPCRVLHDPEGLLEERLGPVTSGEPYYPADDVTLFLYLLGNLVVTVGRGELLVAHGGVGALRDLLVKLMLAENGVHKTDGQKRLNPHLTTEQRTVLEGLPTPGVRADEIVRACGVIRDELVERARRLADLTGASFPEELLAATDQHLARHLG